MNAADAIDCNATRAAKKTDSRYDVLKFVLALLIVALHTQLFPGIMKPWVRIAVPLFFMVSSFFFFRKVNKCTDAAEARGVLAHFVKRSGMLYLFWFAVLLIPTIGIREYFNDGVLTGVAAMARDAVFGSTFVASWFITANVICVCIVFVMCRFKALLGIIGLCLFVLCCLDSNYYNAMPAWVQSLSGIFPGTQLYWSFPAAMLWVWLGMVFAGLKAVGKWQVWMAVVVLGAAMLYAEHVLVNSRHWVRDGDVYFSLAVICPAIFLWVRSLRPFSYSRSLLLRQSSVIFYCVHATVARILWYWLRTHGYRGDIYGLAVFVITLACCVFATWLLLTLVRRKRFSWLKYAF